LTNKAQQRTLSTVNDTTQGNGNTTKLVSIIKSQIMSRDDFQNGDVTLLDREEIKN
jgi:hypothetical protein